MKKSKRMNYLYALNHNINNILLGSGSKRNYRGQNPYKDYDKDRVLNVYDCEPYNPQKQGILTQLIGTNPISTFLKGITPTQTTTSLSAPTITGGTETGGIVTGSPTDVYTPPHITDYGGSGGYGGYQSFEPAYAPGSALSGSYPAQQYQEQKGGKSPETILQTAPDKVVSWGNLNFGTNIKTGTNLNFGTLPQYKLPLRETRTDIAPIMDKVGLLREYESRGYTPYESKVLVRQTGMEGLTPYIAQQIKTDRFAEQESVKISNELLREGQSNVDLKFRDIQARVNNGEISVSEAQQELDAYVSKENERINTIYQRKYTDSMGSYIKNTTDATDKEARAEAQKTIIKYQKGHIVGTIFSYGFGGAGETLATIQTQQERKKYEEETPYKKLLETGDLPSIIRKGFGDIGTTYFGGVSDVVAGATNKTKLSKERKEQGGEIWGNIFMTHFFSPAFKTGGYDEAFGILSPKKKTTQQVLLGENRFAQLGTDLEKENLAQAVFNKVARELVNKKTATEQAKYLNTLAKNLKTSADKETFKGLVQELYNKGFFKGAPLELYNQVAPSVTAVSYYGQQIPELKHLGKIIGLVSSDYKGTASTKQKEQGFESSFSNIMLGTPQKIKQNEQTFVKTSPISNLLLGTSQKVTEKVKQGGATRTASIMSILLGTPQKLRQRTIQISVPRTTQAQSPKLKMPLLYKMDEPHFSGRKRRKKYVGVSVRRFKKWKLHAITESPEEALRLGEEYTKKTLGASFKLEGINEILGVPEEYYVKKEKKRLGEFIQGKLMQPIYIQKRRYRLSAPTEVSEIQAWRRKKGGFREPKRNNYYYQRRTTRPKNTSQEYYRGVVRNLFGIQNPIRKKTKPRKKMQMDYGYWGQGQFNLKNYEKRLNKIFGF